MDTAMTTMEIRTGTDAVKFLKEQHREVKACFEAVRTTRGPARAAAFVALRWTLAVHETAEDEIIHPVARATLPNGVAIVARRLEEERAAQRALTALETLDVDSDAFETGLVALQREVVAHADAEEAEEFEAIATTPDRALLARMTNAAAFAGSGASPGIGGLSPTLLVGRFASMVDRARDAMTTKR